MIAFRYAGWSALARRGLKHIIFYLLLLCVSAGDNIYSSFASPHSLAITGCPQNYAKAKAYVADLGPGDVLYVPPYWWHYVESLSTSISISTWSRFEVVNNNMNPAYERTLYIQRLATNDDRRLGLQLYFSMLVDYVYGPCRARVVVDRLLRQRYDALAPVFDVESGRSSGVCGDQGVVLDGTSADVGAAEAFGLGASVEAGIHKDARFVADHFARIPLPAMDILFLDYLEEIASEVVSASEMAAFFRDCF